MKCHLGTVDINFHRLGLLPGLILTVFCSGLLVLGQNSQPPMPTLGSTNEAPPPPLPVSPGGARVALTITNGVHAPAPPKVRSTGRYGVVCPSCETAQTNVPVNLKCIGQVEVSTNQVRFQYQGEFKCRSCGIQFQKSWYGPVQNDTPVIEIMEEIK